MRNSDKKLTQFGKLVSKALIDKNMTKVQLAAQIGTSPQYLSYILYGMRTGKKYHQAIIAALELDPRKAA
jgi:transcriptional regulator with XRE-family HTH domain